MRMCAGLVSSIDLDVLDPGELRHEEYYWADNVSGSQWIILSKVHEIQSHREQVSKGSFIKVLPIKKKEVLNKSKTSSQEEDSRNIRKDLCPFINIVIEKQIILLRLTK